MKTKRRASNDRNGRRAVVPGRRHGTTHTTNRSVHRATARASTRRERVRLELVRLEVERKDSFFNRVSGQARVGWDIYFLLCMEHPEDPSKSVVWTYPERPIDMRKRDDNVRTFGSGSGATVLECDMPKDRRVTLRCYVMQSKSKTRRTGSVLDKISQLVEDDVAPLATEMAAQSGSAQAVIAVEAGKVVNKGVGLIGQLLADADDKQRGFKSLEHRFAKSDKRQKKPFHTDLGDVRLLARWSTVWI